MNIKLQWNTLMKKMGLGKSTKIRPDNLALFSARKVFFGNPHKAESYLLRQGIDAVGLKLVVVPKNVKKAKEMLDLAQKSSSQMTAKQIRRVESLLFDFLYNRPGYSVASHLKTMLEDFAQMLITTFKFAESNERSVESTFFLYIIANPSFSVIKDTIVLIGLIALFLPLVYWGIYLRLSKDLPRLRRFFQGRPSSARFEVYLGMLGPVCLNLTLLLCTKAVAEWLFIADSSANIDHCFAHSSLHFKGRAQSLLVDSSPTITALVRTAFRFLLDFGLSLGHLHNSPVARFQVKLAFLLAFLLVLNLLVLALKKIFLDLLHSRFPETSNLHRLTSGLEETFTRLFLGLFVASYGVYK